MKRGHKNLSAQEMSEDEIWTKIVMYFTRWNALANGACQDPFWPDGVNMNLVRNHIIYWYRILAARNLLQMNLFGDPVSERPLPPKVSDNYMVRGAKYSKRLDGRYFNPLIWGEKGEYYA